MKKMNLFLQASFSKVLLTPTELRAGPYYLLPERFGEFKFCFHHNALLFCFMDVVEEPSLKGLATSGRQFWPSRPTKIRCPASE